MLPTDTASRDYLVDISMYLLNAGTQGSLVGHSFSLNDFTQQLKQSLIGSYLESDDYASLAKLFCDEGLFVDWEDHFAGYFYQLSNDYHIIYGTKAEGFDTPLYKCQTFGPEWVEKALDGIFNPFRDINPPNKQPTEIIPASDRTVTPTDNQRAESTKALEDFIKEFRQDQHFGNEWAAEKGVLIEALEIGSAYLQNKVINVRIGTMMTIDYLKAVVEKYREAGVNGIVNALAQTAIDLLVDLFKDGLG